MRRETIAVQGGYVVDPTTKSAAVPIYQTASYEFDSAEHGAALFNLEVPGYRYTRISNPTTDVLETTVATPLLLRPFEYGADIVLHSLTKYLGGHGTTMGGIIVDSGKFRWEDHADLFPMFSEPDVSYHNLVYVEHYGAAAYIGRCRSVYQRGMGAVLSPLSAFLLLQGIETVAVRVDRHVENGRRVAEFLRADPRVDWVNYVGFEDNPYHALAQKYLGGRACSLMTFGIRGGFEAGTKFYDALRL